METPFSEPSDPSGSASTAGSPAADSPGIDRQARRFLEHEILPLLEREKHRALVEAVRRALERGELRELESLPERLRYDLLGAIERRLEGGRRPAPKVLVELTTAISAVPEPAAGNTPVPAR